MRLPREIELEIQKVESELDYLLRKSRSQMAGVTRLRALRAVLENYVDRREPASAPPQGDQPA